MIYIPLDRGAANKISLQLRRAQDHFPETGLFDFIEWLIGLDNPRYYAVAQILVCEFLNEKTNLL